jgi:hypothetical protein
LTEVKQGEIDCANLSNLEDVYIRMEFPGAFDMVLKSIESICSQQLHCIDIDVRYGNLWTGVSSLQWRLLVRAVSSLRGQSTKLVGVLHGPSDFCSVFYQYIQSEGAGTFFRAITRYSH